MASRDDLETFFEHRENFERLLAWTQDHLEKQSFVPPMTAEEYLIRAVWEVLAGHHAHYGEGRTPRHWLCIVIAQLIKDDAETAAGPN